jgi:hypothetical protein
MFQVLVRRHFSAVSKEGDEPADGRCGAMGVVREKTKAFQLPAYEFPGFARNEMLLTYEPNIDRPMPSREAIDGRHVFVGVSLPSGEPRAAADDRREIRDQDG